MKKALVFLVEEYFYNPKFLQRLLSFSLLPLSWLYCFIMYLRFRSKNAEDLGIKIISVGNLTVGGSGKTPLVTALAARYEKPAIILRGYGRKSSGMVVVKDKTAILCDVKRSGDEAMVYAKKLSNAVVIVSEDRKLAIKQAKEIGCEIVFLDDAYSKHEIKKHDILISVKTKNSFCLPSGPYREKLWKGKDVLVVEDGIDFRRVVTLKHSRKKMSFVTAIARPQRVEKYLPDVLSKNYFEDHHSFTKEELEAILQRDKSESLLLTMKDYVKVEDFGLPLSLLDLDIELSNSFLQEYDKK